MIVHTVTEFECEVEADTLDEAIDEAKFAALTEGDYISQKAEFEVLEGSGERKLFFIAPPPPKTRKPALNRPRL